MAMVIGTNVASITAQRHLEVSRQSMETSMERLSSGSRINSAMDDSAGLAISGRMTAQVEGYNMAVNNANDGISMLQTAEGALEESTDLLLRMRELSVQASSGTYNATDLTSINKEFVALKDEITRIAARTQFNGTSVLNDTASKDFQVGDVTGDKISITLKVMDAANIGSGNRTIDETAGLGAFAAGATSAVHTLAAVTATGKTMEFSINGNTYAQDFVDVGASAALKSKATLDALGAKIVAGEAGVSAATSDVAGVVFTVTVTAGTEAGQLREVSGGNLTNANVSTQTAALASIANIDGALQDVANYRADLGSVANRLSHTVDNLMSRSENTSAAKSRIQDTNFAAESANLAKAQVLQQAGTAMLAQANASTQNVLSLLK